MKPVRTRQLFQVRKESSRCPYCSYEVLIAAAVVVVVGLDSGFGSGSVDKTWTVTALFEG